MVEKNGYVQIKNEEIINNFKLTNIITYKESVTRILCLGADTILEIIVARLPTLSFCSKSVYIDFHDNT
jgi:hypothetical protein